jgi:hypothetical protein
MKPSQPIPVLVFVLFALIFIVSSIFGEVFNVSNVVQFRNALITSADNSENDVINVAAGVYNIDATLSYWSSEPYSLTIIGAGADLTILDGGRARRILSLETTSAVGNVEIRAMTFRNGVTDGNGGGLLVETSSAAITLSHCEMIDDSSFILGGGACLVSNDGHITVSECVFLRNKSAGSGGLNAASSYGDVTLVNTVFEDNTAFGNETIYGDDGGAHMLYTEGGGSITIRGCSYIRNYSEDGGGGAFTYSLGDGTLITVDSNYFSQNYAELDGGACFVRANVSATINITRNHFHNNFAEVGGGGVQIHLEDGAINYRGNFHESDSTWDSGGAAMIWLSHGTFSADSNLFYRNYATMNGGAISFATEDGVANFSRNISRRNLAGGVGGAFSFATTYGDLNIFNNTSYADSADEGGSMYIYLDQPASSVDAFNNILRQCSLPAFSGSGATAIVARYSNIHGGTGESWFGTGCIDTDPLFIDASSGNFRLGWANFPIADASKSPSIDTGDPASDSDPDGTRADMGAITYNQATYVESEIARPVSLAISTYPNPFNSAVKFAIDGAGECESPLHIEIYDLTGRLIETNLVDGASRLGNDSTIPAGNEFVWQPAETIPSGVYLVRARIEGSNSTSGFSAASKRIVYLK